MQALVSINYREPFCQGRFSIISGTDFAFVIFQGSVAYVAQQAWIQNATVRENVLFSRPFDSSRYEQVIDSCALRQDLEILTAGDSTEIGERVCDFTFLLHEIHSNSLLLRHVPFYL